MDKDAFVKKIQDAFEKLVTLEVVTVVGTYDTQTKQPSPGSKMIRTRLNLLDGNKVTEIDPEIATGSLASLREYHAQIEKQANDLIKANLETIERMLRLLGQLPQLLSAGGNK
jgi:hypothetical protein